LRGQQHRNFLTAITLASANTLSIMLGTANNIISNSNLAANSMDDYKVPQKLTQPQEKLIISGDSVSQPVALAHQRLGSRSQGDDTTRGATAILIPIVTAKVEEELATAKDIVKSLRIVGVIEDEAWDTAMVAEYEGEIFSYMIELEVGLCHLSHVASRGVIKVVM
jgi:hypothetical protein